MAATKDMQREKKRERSAKNVSRERKVSLQKPRPKINKQRERKENVWCVWMRKPPGAAIVGGQPSLLPRLGVLSEPPVALPAQHADLVPLPACETYIDSSSLAITFNNSFHFKQSSISLNV